MAQRKVTAIPATITKYTAVPIGSKRKRRVAGYARVSTDHEDQVTSYEAQVDYYTNYIKGRDDWEFVAIYTDEGISATNTKRREGFKAMVADALAGKIDLIVTKSVSRFARNTVDSLTTVRTLKEKGVEIYFEKENIWTLDAKGELLITIMSSLAQEESRSISENTTWGQRKRFADGKASVAYKRFLGYDRGPNGGFVVNQEQAKTVKLIYKLFLDGLTCHAIAKELTERKLPTPGGKAVWSQSTVRSILTNEKYKGDALLQKEFTVDFLQKKTKKNEGEVPQYYVEGNHEAIIDPATFDYVQAEMARRMKDKHRYSGVSMFSSKIKCGECGCWYGSKVCTPQINTAELSISATISIRAARPAARPTSQRNRSRVLLSGQTNILLSERDELTANTRMVIVMLCDSTELEKRQAELKEELEVVVGLVERCVAENARTALDQDEYTERYNGLVSRYETVKTRFDEVTQAIADKADRKKLLEQFLHTVETQEPVTQFDERLWSSLVDFVTVYSEKDIRVTFKDGTEIPGIKEYDI